MTGRNKVARILTILGSITLLASAGFHSVAASTVLFPTLASSNLNPGMRAALRVVFLSLGWHWVIVAVIALVAALSETKLRKFLVMFCGLAVLLEAVVGATMMGLFIGNKMIGSAGILIAIGGFLFEGATG